MWDCVWGGLGVVCGSGIRCGIWCGSGIVCGGLGVVCVGVDGNVYIDSRGMVIR